MPPWVPPQEVRLARLGQFLDGDGIPIARWLQACMAATTANITIASDIDVGDTLDGVLLATGDRVLVKDQTVGTENGIYVVDSDGSANRSPDMPTGMDALGCMVLVNAGTVNEGGLFRVSGLEPQVVDGGDLTIVEFNAGTAADLVYDDSESADVDDVDAALDLILLALFFRAVLGDEVDRWYDEAGTTTDQAAAVSNVTRQTSPAGPGGRAYLNATGDNQSYITFTGLTVGARIRVEAQTNGDAAVGGSGGGTFLRLVTNAGNTDLDSSQVTWVRRSAVVVIGASTNLEIKGVFSPSWGDLIVTDLDDMGENAASGGGVTDADYLVGTAHAGLSAEIVVPAVGLALLDDTTVAAQQTTLGLGTGDSPQHLAVNVGHASDTTLARASAGVLSVEGNAIYAASGTDVPVADGGTGASTALAARTNLGLATAVRGILPTGALFQTAPRFSRPAAFAVLATARLSMFAIDLPVGTLVSSISFMSTGTAVGTPLNQWFALFDSALAKLAVTVDDTTTAWAANTVKTLAISSPFTTTYSGLHYLGILVKATTVPSIAMFDSAGLVSGIVPALSGNSTTGLTDPASCPNPAAALASTTVVPLAYAFVS